LFRFWQYGDWVDVVVDDFLPCKNERLIFMHSDSKNEFWSALLEKAYAKLHGSYEHLLGGKSSDAMVDFTGGCPESYSLESSKVPKNLFAILVKSYNRKSMICCSITADPYQFEAKTPMGLVMGHAYTVTKVQKLSTGKQFVRVRNPWGNEQEWKGKWADGSKEWDLLSTDDQQQFGLTFDCDGEWWMEYEDFLRYFNELEMCHLCPEKMLRVQEHVFLDVKNWHGKWEEGVSAGGCRNFLSTFISNPQYSVTLKDVDDEDEEELCTLMVSLMQKGRRSLKDEGKEDLSIGFVIYKLENKDQARSQLGENFFKYTAHSALSDSFVNAREVTGRFKLSPGTYCIIPSTFQPDCGGEFLLRSFREKLRSEKKITDSSTENKELVQSSLGLKEFQKKEEEETKSKNDTENKKEPDLVAKTGVNENRICWEKTSLDKVKQNVDKHRYRSRDSIHHFKYENEEDESWACITSPGTTIINITTPGSTVVTITIMDKVTNP